MTARDGLDVDGLVAARDGRPVVTVAALSVPAGTCAVVAGPTGSGKSTLAAALAGHLPATGRVTVDGRRSTGAPSRRLRAGLAAVLPDLPRLAGCSVAEALALAARRGRTATDALARFPLLDGRSRLRADLLSGGEHLLLRIACAWAATPAVLVLDAPTSGLAEGVAADVVALAVAEAERGAAVLWLDRPDARIPSPPTWRLSGGGLSATERSGTGSRSSTG